MTPTMSNFKVVACFLIGAALTFNPKAQASASSSDYDYSCIPLEACGTTDPMQGKRTSTGGSVLMGGGTDVDAAFKWQIDHAAGGNFLVLRESGTGEMVTAKNLVFCFQQTEQDLTQ
jgi:hypothetical protein